MENKKIKILAIDDNRDNLISLKALLSEALPQSVVYMELTGQGGIESARRDDPDVILLDIVMPGMDGYEVCKILKADEQMSETPIIFITALKGDKQSRILALESGGEAFLAKPIDPTELKAQILAMLKIKEAATYKRDQRLQLEELVQKRTEELKGANIAALNLLEDLNAEIEIRKQREEALKESERQYAFLAGTAFDLVKFTSIQNIYEYTARKLYELMDDKGIVAIVDYDINSNIWKMQHIKGLDDKYRDLIKIFGFDIRKLEGEISTKYYEKITSGKLEEIEIDLPGLFNNKISDIIGKAVKKLLSIDKMYCTAIHESEQIFGNITLVTKKSAKPLNIEIIEAFILQVTNFIKKQKSEEKLKLLNRAVEASSISVVITDAEGNINYVNPYFTELTGYSNEELLGKNPRLLKSGNQPKSFYVELWNTILSGKEWTGEFRNKKKNGELYWENAIIAPILNSQGKITNFVAIKEDVTERKKILEELVDAKEHAEESDRLKSAFLANMSHEIRTPLNGILGFSELLKEPGLDGEQQQEYIRIIEKSGARMLNIINDIVDISKIESNLMQVDIEDVNINEKIEFIYLFFKPQVEEKGMQFLFKNTLPTKEATIRTDNEKVYSILTNLVKNAIKYSKEGTIEFGYLKKGETLEFYVKDTGIGIPKERHEAIFERFIQAEITDKMARQGAGLGLSISKAYVEMLGGKIWVESEKGIGSTFYFTLPYNAYPLKETIDRKPLPTEKNETVRKLKILIAEDDEVSQMLVERFMIIFSKEILKARTGVETVKACRENPDIDLVLMDIQMPEMGGYEATQQIRDFNKEVIIIAQTAYGLSGDREKAIEAGCNDYIAKPINKTELQAMIQKYFGKII
jgi:hypothetical protein